jgi:hypothetical protein
MVSNLIFPSARTPLTRACIRRQLAALALAALALPAAAFESALELASLYAQQVNPRLAVPADEQIAYGNMLQNSLRDAGQTLDAAQFALLVDRNPFVQAALLYWVPPQGLPSFIGASPVSTGKPGRYEYFETPTGVFEHSIFNPDFRAEGTLNELGIRGYGIKGMRVFDFGWQTAVRGWGSGGTSLMRLQMHATDPAHLEPRLGSAQSKGCIRIPAALNVFLDHYSILDADYEDALARGHAFWVLRPDRVATPWPGRFLVVMDTRREARPDWALQKNFVK